MTVKMLNRAVWHTAIFAVLLTLSAPAVAIETGRRLTTEKEFRGLVVDRKLTADRTILSYTGDGRMEGTSGGEQIEGMWRWAGSTLCRTVTVGTRNLGLDCQAVFVVGDLVVIVRNEGLGTAFALRIRGEGSSPGKPGHIACFC